jgi:hypothetical protein
MEPKRLIQQCGWKDGDRGGDLAKEKQGWDQSSLPFPPQRGFGIAATRPGFPFGSLHLGLGLAPAAMPEMTLIGGNGRY